jgi:ATP-dependent helicase HrpB
MKVLPRLPIDEVLPDLVVALDQGTRAVLQAPPGAGKTTRVPLALLDRSWVGDGKILMLEPRRLATRAAARRMAQELGEEVGETIGYRVHLESRVGPRTRVEVVTEAILTRRLQQDPALDGVACVIFDEFHERSLNSDLGLALTLDAQSGLREDLRILVMSATLDGHRIAALLDDAPVISSDGRIFPVEIRYVDRAASERFEDAMAVAIRRALREEQGSVLAFLPGEGEIRRVAERLAGQVAADCDLAPLYGALSPAEQDRAIRPTQAGRRKIVLATTIAETSLTIEGIRIVVDGGVKRVPRFDPRSGMTRLETVRVSRASAEQRRGRAGRLEPGICYRLWPEAEDRALAPYDTAEILQADLAGLALELAAWGVNQPQDLRWLDPPPTGAWTQARALLLGLEALEESGAITGLGREMAGLPLHPRLAHMVLRSLPLGHGGLACAIAALLSEGDPLRGGRDADLRLRLYLLNGRGGQANASGPRLARVREGARDLRRRLKVPGEMDVSTDRAGEILALAFPDRIAQRRGGLGRFRLANGGGAVLPEADPLASADFLAVAELDGAARDAKIYLAAPLSKADIEEAFANRIRTCDVIRWDDRQEAVIARRQRVLSSIILDDRPLPSVPQEQIALGLLDGVRQRGLACLPWSEDARNLRLRVGFVAANRADDGWPDWDDETLLETLEDWLSSYLAGMTRLADLSRLDLAAILETMLGWNRRAELDRLAPTHVVVPTGSRLPLDYATEGGPVLAVRLQEMFGQQDTPRIVDGSVAVLLHLLSPARRPLAVTRDLRSFWAGPYQQVRGEMRGRYPKHPWPDDPVGAAPTNRVKPRPTGPR